MAHVTLLQYDADGFQLPSSGSPGRDIVQNRPFLGYPAGAESVAYTKPISMPGSYAGGTLKASIGYIMASATSGKVNFETAVEAVTDGDTTDLDAGTSFDTMNDASVTVPGTAGHLDVITVTLANKDSVAAGDLVTFSLKRDGDDGTDDGASGDARVLWMEVWEET